MRLLAAVLALLITALPMQADNAQITRLYELMRVAHSVEILRDEGFGFALDSESSLFEGQTSGNWSRAVDQVYDLARLEALVHAGFVEALQGVDLAPLFAFYESEAGARVVELELTARRAFMSPDVEQMAREAWSANPEAGMHAAMIADFIKVNDLIERNVIGAMNSNFKFLRALSIGQPDLTEVQILSDVWAEEEYLREDTREWMFAFLTMAYAPLSTAEMQANLALWQSKQGRALNSALFVGFDRMFEQISEDLGAAAARMLLEQEL